VTSGTGSFGWSTVVPADASQHDVPPLGRARDRCHRDRPTSATSPTSSAGWSRSIRTARPAPRKRTALGRLGHEGCWPGAFVAGKQAGLVHGRRFAPRISLQVRLGHRLGGGRCERGTDRLAIGDKYMDAGTLYTAKFNADGTGAGCRWCSARAGIDASNAAYPFADQADLLVNARLAADAVGATPMDRPEWTAVNPATGEVYLTLTNNNATLRPLNGTDAANPRHYNDPVGAS
jgi:secreted PhoX family phosphatase